MAKFSFTNAAVFHPLVYSPRYRSDLLSRVDLRLDRLDRLDKGFIIKKCYPVRGEEEFYENSWRRGSSLKGLGKYGPVGFEAGKSPRWEVWIWSFIKDGERLTHTNEGAEKLIVSFGERINNVNVGLHRRRRLINHPNLMTINEFKEMVYFDLGVYLVFDDMADKSLQQMMEATGLSRNTIKKYAKLEWLPMTLGDYDKVGKGGMSAIIKQLHESCGVSEVPMEDRGCEELWKMLPEGKAAYVMECFLREKEHIANWWLRRGSVLRIDEVAMLKSKGEDSDLSRVEKEESTRISTSDE